MKVDTKVSRLGFFIRIWSSSGVFLISGRSLVKLGTCLVPLGRNGTGGSGSSFPLGVVCVHFNRDIKLCVTGRKCEYFYSTNKIFYS